MLLDKKAKNRERFEEESWYISIPDEDRIYHLKKKEFDPPEPKFEPDKIESPFIGVKKW